VADHLLITSCFADEPLPLESVLDNPIYSLVEEDDTEPLATEEGAADAEAPTPDGPLGCMLCPNKVLKNEKMVEVHLESKVSLCSQCAQYKDTILI
jgi:hypothetical protein